MTLNYWLPLLAQSSSSLSCAAEEGKTPLVNRGGELALLLVAAVVRVPVLFRWLAVPFEFLIKVVPAL